MKDRVPTPGQEGRVKITPESGGAAYYAKLEMADNPTQAGDEPIKANLLPDDVASALGLTGNPQVKDAFTALKTLADIGISRAQIVTGSYVGTGATSKTIPCGGAPKLAIIFCPRQDILIGASGMSALMPVVENNIINGWAVPVSWGENSITIQDFGTTIKINASEERFNPYYYAIFL